MTTTQVTRTRIKVPPGTVEVVENAVLVLADLMGDEPPPVSAYMASAARKCLNPLPSGAHEFRFDLRSYHHRAAALWLVGRLRELLDRPLHTVPNSVVEKRDPLSRIGNDLDRALRRAGVEVEA